MACTVRDLALFHTTERNLYKRLVRKLKTEAEVAKAVIALWLWMESIGHHELVHRISSFDDQRLRLLVAEAQACLHTLRPTALQPTSVNDIPITANLLNEPINLRFFHYHQEVASKGVHQNLQSICNVIFDDNVMKLINQQQPSGSHEVAFGESFATWSFTPRFGSTGAGSSTGWTMLNPQAKPWAPELEHSSQDNRSMFITFSRGYPLTREEILKFFTSKWGNCVEALMIERPQPGMEPMFGRVVFNNVSVIPLILNGNQTAKFVINGKHLRARIFVPRQN